MVLLEKCHYKPMLPFSNKRVLATRRKLLLTSDFSFDKNGKSYNGNTKVQSLSV